MPYAPRESGQPIASSAAARRRLESQRRADTKPEVALRRALHRLGLRYRLHAAVVTGTRRSVDIVFPSVRVAIDVRGCYWHGCDLHGTAPKANAEWWGAKLDANRERDADTVRRLEEEGWLVVVAWEHDDPITTAVVIADAIKARRIPAGART
jgi:DNA mismatch endonuclease (patch repair protein)